MSSRLGQNSFVTLIALILMGAILSDVVINLGGDIPQLPRLTVLERPQLSPSFDTRIEALFTRPQSKALISSEPSHSPFFTRFFEPPKKIPPPKKPKTAKYKITFQGLYETSSEKQKIFLMVNDQFKSVLPGETIAADLILLRVERNSIEIGRTNTTPTNIGFRQTTTIEIPAP